MLVDLRSFASPAVLGACRPADARGCRGQARLRPGDAEGRLRSRGGPRHDAPRRGRPHLRRSRRLPAAGWPSGRGCGDLCGGRLHGRRHHHGDAAAAALVDPTREKGEDGSKLTIMHLRRPSGVASPLLAGLVALGCRPARHRLRAQQVPWPSGGLAETGPGRGDGHELAGRHRQGPAPRQARSGNRAGGSSRCPTAGATAGEEGELLLRVDDALQRAQLRLAEDERKAALAQRDQACLAAERAARERERTRGLAAQGIVSTDQIDGVDSQARTADGRLPRRAGQRPSGPSPPSRSRGRQLDKTVLRAPFDGVVADTFIEEGEWTSPSPPALPIPPVLDLIDTRSIYVSAPMDEVDSAPHQEGPARAAHRRLAPRAALRRARGRGRALRRRPARAEPDGRDRARARRRRGRRHAAARHAPPTPR